MTTVTPTSNDEVKALGGPPAGLPDVATLANLANAFFRMLPGDAGDALPESPTGVPGAPASTPLWRRAAVASQCVNFRRS